MDCCTLHTCQSLHPKLSPIYHFLEVSSCISMQRLICSICSLLSQLNIPGLCKLFQSLPGHLFRQSLLHCYCHHQDQHRHQAGTNQEILWDCIFLLNGAETSVIFFAPCWKVPIKQSLRSNSEQLVRRMVCWSVCMTENLIWSLQKALFNKMYSSLK